MTTCIIDGMKVFGYGVGIGVILAYVFGFLALWIINKLET